MNQHKSLFFPISLVLMACSLTACMSQTSTAPIVDGWQQERAQASSYTVAQGDTIYSIAWAFGLDYRALARVNNISTPYEIDIGQQLSMATAKITSVEPAAIYPQVVEAGGGDTVTTVNAQTQRLKISRKPAAKPGFKPKIIRHKAPAPFVNGKKIRWSWPASGEIFKSYQVAGNKGIDIQGRYGEPIRAAASGDVVYAGAGIRGYGKLLIIKSSDNYLTAYAYNSELLVREGNRVRRGQQIAKMGNNNAGLAALHFEIRRDGLPVNPKDYLA